MSTDASDESKSIEDEASIVLDCGSGSIKAGFSNETSPSIVFPSVVGRTRAAAKPSVLNQPDSVVLGHRALRKRGLLSLRYPIEHGIIVNWDDLEAIWRHTFYDEMRTEPEGKSAFLCEAALSPKANREKSVQVLFEKFGLGSVAMASQSILGLFSYGRTSGIVLESGQGVTHAVPIFEGNSLPQSIRRLDLGGRDVTDYLVKLLAEQGHTFASVAEREVVRAMKETACFVAKREKDAASDVSIDYDYELPDGNSLRLSHEMRQAPEMLLKPSLVGSEQGGLAKVIADAIMRTELDLRRLFWRNIVLCGGNTMFDGLRERLHAQLCELAPKSVMVKVNALENRKYNVWTGAAIVSDIASFRKEWFSKREYEENGPSRINAMTPF